MWQHAIENGIARRGSASQNLSLPFEGHQENLVSCR
jgi:hypothetical protein